VATTITHATSRWIRRILAASAGVNV